MTKSFNEMMARQAKYYIQHHRNEINNLENVVKWHEAKDCKEPNIAKCYLYKDDYIYILNINKKDNYESEDYSQYRIVWYVKLNKKENTKEFIENDVFISLLNEWCKTPIKLVDFMNVFKEITNKKIDKIKEEDNKFIEYMSASTPNNQLDF